MRHARPRSARAQALGVAARAPLDACLLHATTPRQQRGAEAGRESDSGRLFAANGREMQACQSEEHAPACLTWAANSPTARDAIFAYSLGCRLGSAQACYELGALLRDGATEQPPDSITAAKFLLQACRAGDPRGSLKTALAGRGAAKVFPRGTGRGSASAQPVRGVLRSVWGDN